VVNVTGLEEDTSARALTFSYLIENSTLPTFAPTTLTLLPWFFIFTMLGMAGGAIYAFFQS
jgi:hypothetical protein